MIMHMKAGNSALHVTGFTNFESVYDGREKSVTTRSVADYARFFYSDRQRTPSFLTFLIFKCLKSMEEISCRKWNAIINSNTHFISPIERGRRNDPCAPLHLFSSRHNMTTQHNLHKQAGMKLNIL